MLNRYHDGSIDASSYIKEIVERVTHAETGELTVIISAAVTYSSLERLKMTVEDAIHTNWRVNWVLLYRLAEAEPPQGVRVLCDLQNFPEDGAFRPMVKCPEGKDAIDIDPTTYFPVSSIIEHRKRISAAMALPSKTFFTKYSGGNCFSLHRDNFVGRGRFRHHAIFPDVEQFLKHPEFIVGFERKLSGIGDTPTHIVVPTHDAGLAMAKFASEFFAQKGGNAPKIWEHLSLAFKDSDTQSFGDLQKWLQNAGENESILILDDVILTGDRLKAYQRSLRNVWHAGKERPYKGRIHCIVGLARPPKRDIWDSIVRRHKHRGGSLKPHTVDAVEQLILPNWKEDECPWCKELDILQMGRGMGGKYPLSLVKRMAALQKPIDHRAGDGIEAFLRLASIGNDAPFKLLTGSIFGPEGMSDVDTFVSVASTIQSLRNDAGLGMVGFPNVHLLDAEDYVGANFSDSILRAALVRTGRRKEMEHLQAKDEDLRRNLVKKAIMEQTEQPCIALELLIACALHKLPWPEFSDEEVEELKSRGHGESLTAIISRFQR